MKNHSNSVSSSVPPALFMEFDLIRIVNLKERTDRRAEMEQQLARVGMSNDYRVAFFPALSFSDPGPFKRIGSHGAFRSHLALLEDAAERGASILILQDDCDFLIPQIYDYCIPENWEIFYGGYYASDPEDPQNSDIVGAHFMGFSAKAAEIAASYLRNYLNPEFTPDSKAAGVPGFDPSIRPPIDGAFVWMRRAHPELTTTFAMLGVQRPSRTDIGDKHFFDRMPGLKQFAGLARRFHRKLKTFET